MASEADRRLNLIAYQRDEHRAWLAVVGELRAAGAGDINAGGENEGLCAAICTWGELLAQLRLNDPDPTHAEKALEERLAAYPVTDEAV